VGEFLGGAAAMDAHFVGAPHRANLPVIMGLLGVWNATFLGLPARALLPYAQALLRLPAHIQQGSMESNGKRVGLDGAPEGHDVARGECWQRCTSFGALF
jgi:glucose-6-phosphate isomerase